MRSPKETIAALTRPPQAQRGEAPVVVDDGAHRRERHRRAAVEAAPVRRVAVDLDQPLGGKSGALVQAVDVLRDEREEPPLLA